MLAITKLIHYVIMGHVSGGVFAHSQTQRVSSCPHERIE